MEKYPSFEKLALLTQHGLKDFKLKILTLFGGGGGGRGALTLRVNNLFDIEANATKLGSFP